jgi:hypothetical protein
MMRRVERPLVSPVHSRKSVCERSESAIGAARLVATGVAALALAALAACGTVGSPSASPSKSASPTASARPSVTLVPTVSSQPTNSALTPGTPTPGTPTPSATPQATFDCSKYQGQTPQPFFDPVLEAYFPASVAGRPLARPVSYSFMSRLCRTGGADAFVSELPAGIDPSPIAVADAFPDLPPGVPDITGFRTPGNNAEGLQSFFVAATLSNPPPSGDSVRHETVAGKDVTVLYFGPIVYLYPSGDVLFMISKANDAQLEAILQALP